MRRVSTIVLPEPAVATMASGWASVSTARRCWASSPCSSRSVVMPRHHTQRVRDGSSALPAGITTVATMPYPKKNLNANETIALDMHPHWWYFAEPAFSLLGAIILSIVVLVKTDNKGLKLVMLALLVVTAVWLLIRYLKW